MGLINKCIKRIFDIICSGIGILVLLPVYVIVSILIISDSKGGVLFKQTRIGLHGKEFKILKFRTMVVDAENVGTQITIGNDSRITKIGSFLRKYKLDELPQLFNVFIGDMSLVGPRPEVPRYVKLYNEEERKVLEVRPGITDLASIKYRDENELLGSVDDPEKFYVDVIMKEKLELNMEYIKKSNVFFDVFIIVKTILKCI